MSFSSPPALAASTSPGLTTGAYSGVTCSTANDVAETSIERGAGFRFVLDGETVQLHDAGSGMHCDTAATVKWTVEGETWNNVFAFYCGDVEVIGSGIYEP